MPEPAIFNRDIAYESLWPVGRVDWSGFWKFNCVPKLREWDIEKALVSPTEVQRPSGDFPALTHGCLVLSERASTALGDLVSASGELLPLRCNDGRSFVLCNPVPCYDCLNQETTRGKRFDGTRRWMYIERYQFHRDALPEAPLFKVSGNTTAIFCSAEFKLAVENAGLAGLMFREVWNDDGNPIEAIDPFDFLR